MVQCGSSDVARQDLGETLAGIAAELGDLNSLVAGMTDRLAGMADQLHGMELHGMEPTAGAEACLPGAMGSLRGSVDALRVGLSRLDNQADRVLRGEV